MNRLKLSIYLAFILIATTSCTKLDAYAHYYEMKDAIWERSNELVFNIEPTHFELGVGYTLVLDIQNNIDYDYRNIYIEIDANHEQSDVFVRQVQECTLAKDDGEWLGDGFAFIRSVKIPLKEKFKFTQKRKHKIVVRHRMADDALGGIEKIGLRIQKEG